MAHGGTGLRRDTGWVLVVNAWTGKGIILAILANALPVDAAFLALAIFASAFGTLGAAIEAGVVGDPLWSKKREKQ